MPGVAELFSSRAFLLALAGLFYAGRLTFGHFDLFGANWFGLVYNSMLDHMLHGEWDVDPAALGKEAYVHGGKAYAYFGPFPALLRLPLLAWTADWRSVHVERLSCWLAIMVGIAAQCSAISGSLTPSLQRQLGPPLLLACALSGPPMLLSWKGAAIYHEVILWAWAFAVTFVAIALPALWTGGPIGRGRLYGLALCAGLCLLTRSSTGAGLVLLAGVLIAREAVRAPTRTSGRGRVLGPLLVLVLLVGLAGLVNQGRWGSPFVFADLRQQADLIEEFPDRLVRLERHGLFDPHRLWTGVLYYFLPIWTAGLERLSPLSARLFEYYDGIERPASSFLLTDPAWCWLSLVGIVALVRRRVPARSALLVAGLSLAPASMLVAWYLAFRYRAEFAPLLLALSCIGLRAWGARTVAGDPAHVGSAGGRGVVLLTVLCALQVGLAAFTGRSYTLQFLGPAAGYEGLSLHCALGWRCPDAPKGGPTGL